MEEKQEILGILLLSHGNFAIELLKSAEMIIGKQKNVQALSLLPGEDPVDFIVKVRGALAELPEDTLILNDLFGGTPSNVSAAILAETHLEALAGLNMAMLIEACTARLECHGKDLAQRALAAGCGGCKDIGKEFSHLENII